MPAKQDKLLKYAFAEQGEKTPFSIDPDGAGLVSMAQGFTNRYSKNPEADGEYVLRDIFNQMQFIISNAIKNMQRNGGVFWSRENADSIGGYKAGERVLVWRDLTTNQIVESPRTASGDYLITDTIELVSMKDNNLTSPFDNFALFKDWLVNDGNELFTLKTYTQPQNGEFFKIPSGYLDFGDSEVADKAYNFSDFKRVEYMKNQNKLPVYFIDQNDGTFKLLDVRGYFQRMWSNGSTIDSGRAFATLQSDRLRDVNIEYNKNRIGLGYFGFVNLGHNGKGTHADRLPKRIMVSQEFNESKNMAFEDVKEYAYSTAAVDNLNNGNYILSYCTPLLKLSKVFPSGPDTSPYNFSVKYLVKV